MIKVSIIVPIYNVEKYIEPCLRSIAAQTFTDFELILIDDRGKDNSMEIAHAVLSDYPNLSVKIITQPKNLGLSAARNRGTEEATGEYIYYIDSDDYIPSDALEKLVKATDGGTKKVITGDFT